MRQVLPWMAAAVLAVAVDGATAATTAATTTTAPATTRTTAATGREYVVQKGDVLIQLARSRVGDERRWTELAELNGLRPPYALQPGQRLVLPPGWPMTAPAGRATTGTGIASAGGEPAGSAPAPLPAARAFRTSRRGAQPAEAPPAARPGGQLASPATSGPGAGLSAFPDLTQYIAVYGAVATGLIAVVGALVWWVLFALCLRGACWFALVETTTGACFRLALYLILLAVACAAVGMLLPALGGSAANVPAMLALGAVAVVTFFVVSLIVARRILACQWRSVVTVLVMATFVWDLLAAGLAVGVFAILSTVTIGG